MMHEHKVRGSGRSSFDLVDVDKLFLLLSLKGDPTILDLGCGPGLYDLEMAKRLNGRGMIHAVDIWQEGLDELKNNAEEQGLTNILPVWGDAGKTIPLSDASVDICFMAAVFHDFVQEGIYRNTVSEISRVLKPEGRAALVEFKKIDSPGPPKRIRLTPDELAEIFTPQGFVAETTADVGQTLYLAVFAKGHQANGPSRGPAGLNADQHKSKQRSGFPRTRE